MNATDCARATEPHSTTARHKARPKLTARRPTCGGCGTSANIATILSRAYHPYTLRGRGAVRVVTCGAPATARKLKSNVLPDPPPDPAASATLFSDRHCRGGSVVVSSSRADLNRASFPDRGERRD